MRLLLDRALDEGGINYGNRRILGRLTEPIPGPTALMLAGAAGPADHPRIAAAVAVPAAARLDAATTWNTCAGPSWPWTLYRDQPGVAEALAALGRSASGAALDHRAATRVPAADCRAATPWPAWPSACRGEAQPVSRWPTRP